MKYDRTSVQNSRLRLCLVWYERRDACVLVRKRGRGLRGGNCTRERETGRQKEKTKEGENEVRCTRSRSLHFIDADIGFAVPILKSPRTLPRVFEAFDRNKRITANSNSSNHPAHRYFNHNFASLTKRIFLFCFLHAINKIHEGKRMIKNSMNVCNCVSMYVSLMRE